MEEVVIVQNFDKALEIMHGVGEWMEQGGMNPSQWWQPQNMNREFMLKRTEPDEYYVAIVDGKPVASAILQETERNQSWKYIDGKNPKRALYVHWLCVARNFAGKGYSKAMIDFAVKEAKKRGFKMLRLDTEADEEKLCNLYSGLGFKLMGIEKEESCNTAYFEMKV